LATSYVFSDVPLAVDPPGEGLACADVEPLSFCAVGEGLLDLRE
jgi:hypothetical protein